MNTILKRFADQEWSEVAPGAKEKRFTEEGQTIRLVQFSHPFEEIEFCTKQHVGFVVSGNFSIEFWDSKCQFREGDAFSIPAGASTAHRAVITEHVTLFLVEPALELTQPA